MQQLPTDTEVEEAAGLLVDTYDVSARLLGRLFDTDHRDQANSLLQTLGGDRLAPLELARLLVRRDGPELFAGSNDGVQELRLRVLRRLSDPAIEALFEQFRPANSGVVSASHMRSRLAKKRWTCGGAWAREFVAATGFPAAFAGGAAGERVPVVVDVPPLRVPPKLAEFQQGLKDRMLAVLNQSGAKTRCVVTLPTGGGKTRVTVEAFIDWLHPRFAAGKYLVWVAQSEELCEQAIACVEQMWRAREFVGALRVYRYFGGRDVPPTALCGGVVVASIQQLYYRIQSRDPVLDVILTGTGAVIIDEAHRAVSAMYKGLFDRAAELCGPDLFPVCGLTATPGRAGQKRQADTIRLVERFQAYLIKPDLGPGYEANPLTYFRERQFLARARHVVYHLGRERALTDEEVEAMDGEEGVPTGLLRRLAVDRERNLLVARRLLEVPAGVPTLVYACTVDHAYFLATILSARGRRAAAVSAATPAAVRRALVQDFKDGRLEFLCNFSVLTTGFDAPKAGCIALCRPTTSAVLYEQIIGRGLRGPAFGGTAECEVIDFADNIFRLGRPLAYKRFADLWTDTQDEGG